MRSDFPPTRWTTLFLALALVFALSAMPASAATKRHKNAKHASTASAHKKGTHAKKSAHSKKTAKARGQQAIQSERARQIQEALIREHYLDGEPSGSFDQQTREALTRFQGDNGWQTKVVPDSRALIKLGLGPDHSQMLNPEILNQPQTARDQVPGGAPIPQ